MIQATRARGSVAWWLAGVLILWTVQGCGGPVRYIRAVKENPEQVVRLEARYGQSRPHGYDSAVMPFDHPAIFSRIDGDNPQGVRVQLRKASPSVSQSQVPRKRLPRASGGHSSVWLKRLRKPDRMMGRLFSPSARRGNHRGGPGVAVTSVDSGGRPDSISCWLIIAPPSQCP